MKFMKQMISLCLVLALLCSFVPVGVRAEEAAADELLTVSAEATVQGHSKEQLRLVNPFYASVVTEEDFVQFPRERVQTYANPNYVESVDEAAEVLREQMKVREQYPVVYINIDTTDADYISNLFLDVFYTAMEHTGVPTEGDYLSWQWDTLAGEYSYEGVQGDVDLTLYYGITYCTTAEEEAVMDDHVETVLANLNLNGKTDYEKVKGVYDYICSNVDYDYVHLETPDYLHMYTAYAALVNKTAVCQGFALLMYRLTLELGVDCRFIGGDSGGPHAWNIVELDNLYYNADSTWDEDMMDNYQWFLKCPANFPDHIRDEQFTTAAFDKAYPMATADYVSHTHSYTATVTPPTCTEKGYTTYSCGCGDNYRTDEVNAVGHKWDNGVVTKEPTAAAPGIKTYTCTVCKTTQTEDVPFVGIDSESVFRISGKDRVKTALSVAKALKDTLGVEKFDAVIIATGVNEKFADALAGSYLANVKGAPILLYTNSGLSQLNVEFIRQNLRSDGTVYILGGTGAIPAAVEETLSAYSVKRLSGKTRYETNLAILKEAGADSAQEILVATGTNFADSLSASAVGLPLMLVNGKGDGLNAIQIEFLKSVAGKKVTIIGGTGAVSEEVEAAIEAVVGVEAERISGKLRHNTSVLIAQKYFPDADSALLTYAQNFPDGLAGGPLAYAKGAPLLLTQAGKESIANEYIAAEGIESGYVLGGDSAVSDATAQKAFGLNTNIVITKAYYTE